MFDLNIFVINLGYPIDSTIYEKLLMKVEKHRLVDYETFAYLRKLFVSQFWNAKKAVSLISFNF